jgi:hypothetical protein
VFHKDRGAGQDLRRQHPEGRERSDRDGDKVDRFEEVRCRLRSPRRITSRAGPCRPFR